jgi:hypothetical protein
MALFFSTPKAEDLIVEIKNCLNRQDTSQAIKLLSKAERKNIFHSDLFLLSAKVYGLQGDSQHQDLSLRRFFAEDERDVLHHLKAVDFFITEKNFSLAQILLNQIKALFPLSAFTHPRQAALHCAQADYESASHALIQKQQYGKLDDRDIDLVHQIRKGVAANPLTFTKQLFSDKQVREILRRYCYERFESLGFDCEFGFIQRANGREPLSLFRWGAMPIDSMIALFNNQFDGFAQPESASLKLLLNQASGTAEYRYVDSQYQFEAHTFHTKKNIAITETEETLLPKVRAHFALLARKLREDLEDGNKVFLYKSEKSISVDQCKALHAAMQTLGPNKLLVVMREPKNAPKTNTPYLIIEPSLVIGYVDYFWTDEDNPLKPNISLQSWDSLIQHTYHHFWAYFPELDII